MMDRERKYSNCNYNENGIANRLSFITWVIKKKEKKNT